MAIGLVSAPSAMASRSALRNYRWPGVHMLHGRQALHSYLLHKHSVRRHAWSSHARAAVVGGVQDSIEQFPWQVVVFAEFEVEGERAGLLCGGSIIDMSHIVTAAHCAFNPVSGQPLTAKSFVVVAGISSITSQEIKEGATVQVRFADDARVHPDFDYAAGPGTPDDVAVLQLESPLTASSAVKPIGLPVSASNPPEGTDVILSGFGEENPNTELNGNLYSIEMVLKFSRQCGGEADALFLCGSNVGGSGCSGDSGSGVTVGSPGVLVGVMDTVEVISGKPCQAGSDNGFVNVAAPEIRDFIEGGEDPPLAPRGGGVSVRAVPQVGDTATCEPGSWRGSPTFTYSFIGSADGQTLQSGASSTYQLTSSDVGLTIYCQVQASNAGGTGVARTTALPPVRALEKPGSGLGPGTPYTPAPPTQAELEASERAQREADERALGQVGEPQTPAPPRCVVPSLKGYSLSKARRALRKAHCRLGKVTGPRAHHGALVVTEQSAKHGKKLADDARIGVTLGPAPLHRR